MTCENSTSVSEVARARHNSQISIAKAIGIILMVALYDSRCYGSNILRIID